MVKLFTCMKMVSCQLKGLAIPLVQLMQYGGLSDNSIDNIIHYVDDYVLVAES